MLRRCWIVGALALWVGGSGCTTTARRTDGPTAFSSRIWGEAPAPAPPQRQVTLPPEREETPVASAAPTGLSKYFPGLRRNPVETPSPAAASRPTWFSFNRRPKPTEVYMTDARSGLTQGMTQASALPVAIQIPSDRAADSSVTPARAETVTASSDLVAPTSPSAPVANSASKGDVPPPLTGSAATPPGPGPGDQAANPQLPADDLGAGLAANPAVNRMPELPPVDPRERPRLSSMTEITAPAGLMAQSPQAQKSDNQATKAVPAASDSATSAESPEPTTLAGFFHKLGSKGRATPHLQPTTVLASPQSVPSPQSAPKPKVQPSPQVTETSHACVCENCGAKIGKKKPCILKRMRKAIFQGETATVTASAQQ
jgi:hypothetical protein